MRSIALPNSIFRPNPHGSIKQKSSKRNILMASALTAVIAIAVVLPFNHSQAKSDPAHSAINLTDINVNDGFSELVKAVRPAVVNISVTGTASSTGNVPGFSGQSPQLEEFFRKFFGDIPELQNHQNQKPQNQQPYERKTTAVGSGFIVDSDGLVVTNNHVIENADSIEVVFEDGTRVPATLKGVDSKTDLALLEIKTDHPLPYVIFGDSDEAEVGDWVVAIGNPFGLGGTTTSGIISARGRDIRSGPLDDFIQIDASINRGNSGGPLFNTRGEVIGVNSAIYSPNGGSVGIGFAIPSSMAKNVISQLADSGVVERGYLGVHIQALTPEITENLGIDGDNGALITQIVEGSPADKSDLEAGDVIVSYDGQTLGKMRDLPRFVAMTTDGSNVDVKVWRNNSYKTVKVAIAANKEPELASALPVEKSPIPLGLKLATVDKNNRSTYGLDEEAVGVIIVNVEPDSNAAQKGLRPGDIIKRVDQSDVTEPGDVFDAIEQSRKDNKKSVLLLVERNKQSRFIVVSMKA
jgi:serine protease Do